MAPRARPQLSITLPRNFTFHYTDGAEPKTPEREEIVPKPSPPQPFRIKRRVRPNMVSPSVFGQPESVQGAADVPIPTIEIPALYEPTMPAIHHRNTEPVYGYLAPISSKDTRLPPRTPSPSAESAFFGASWNNSERKTFGESISRPLSVCSITSDSSDDSDDSSNDSSSLGGSCTSPESDAADPFTFSTIRKGKSTSYQRSLLDTPSLVRDRPKSRTVHWTAEMDKHIWSTYMAYLQDPTVTPFKMLPGSPPPLGVCHRVAREAKRTWRGAKSTTNKPSDPIDNPTKSNSGAMSTREGSPDTIKAERSGSSTPTCTANQKQQPWPKSGSSARRRFRELCKRKATIAPHYRRLLQSRSPSPLSSPRSVSRSVRLSSSIGNELHQPSFGTRDIHISLTASASTTMQADGPLARLAEPQPRPTQRDEWFNDPNVPWASPAPIPSSEIDTEMGNHNAPPERLQLGSPFGYHTWGPSRSRQFLRPTTPTAPAGDTHFHGPSLKSPIKFHGTFPYPSTHKRRAQHQLEDELSPGGTDLTKPKLEDLFGGPVQSSHRRVRTRGFSLGDVTVHDRLTAMFTPPSEGTTATVLEEAESTVDTGAFTLLPPSEAESIKRLGSPFAGIGGRPSRVRGRHLASASLSSYDPNTLISIDQRLSQANFSSLG